MATYPSFETILSGPDKNNLLHVKRSIRSVLPLVFWFLGSLAVVYFFCELSEDPNYEFLFRWISPRWLGIVPALFLLEILRRRFDDLYVFSDQRVQKFQGRISLSYSVPTVTYIDIRSLSVVQTIWGRILNYGDILIGTAAQADEEMRIAGVLAPNELLNLLDRFRTESTRNNKFDANSA